LAQVLFLAQVAEFIATNKISFKSRKLRYVSVSVLDLVSVFGIGFNFGFGFGFGFQFRVL
jgi:hypothetical protein